MARTLDGCYSAKDVSYSCGYCGYELNLSSSTRNTANIGSKYGKHIRKGVISFFAIDESRFTQTDEVSCTPYIPSSCSWGFFRNRTRLVCRKCGGHIGDAYEDEDSTFDDIAPMAAACLFGRNMLSRLMLYSPLPTSRVFPPPYDKNLNCCAGVLRIWCMQHQEHHTAHSF